MNEDSPMKDSPLNPNTLQKYSAKFLVRRLEDAYRGKFSCRVSMSPEKLSWALTYYGIGAVTGDPDQPYISRVESGRIVYRFIPELTNPVRGELEMPAEQMPSRDEAPGPRKHHEGIHPSERAPHLTPEERWEQFARDISEPVRENLPAPEGSQERSYLRKVI